MQGWSAPRVVVFGLDKSKLYDVRVIVESHGYEVFLTDDPAQVYAHSETDAFSAAIIDLDEGANDEIFTIARKIRHDHNLPVIFTTLYDWQDLWQKAKTANPVAYLEKPVRERELLSALEIASVESKLKQKREDKKEVYQTLIQYLREGVILIDQMKKIIYMNDSAALITGYGRDESLGQDWHTICRIIRNQAETGTSTEKANDEVLVYRDGYLVSKDSKKKAIWYGLFALGRSDAGEPSSIALIFGDETCLREVQETLRIKQSQLDSILNLL